MKNIMKIVMTAAVITVLLTECQNHSDIADVIEPDLSGDSAEESSTEESSTEENTDPEDKIDVDLTAMGSDMVYATVYQMMTAPKDFEGKTVRMRGSYYAVYYEPTQKYYHYCIIQDAMACCSQGMEFVWDDGSHIYPDEYPQEQTCIIVTGVFETYTEDNDSNQYCRLRDAVMQNEK